MAKLSPTQRTLAKLRKDGWTCAITEKWNPWAKVRQDLFGFIDILAIKKGRTLGIQATTMDHKGHRIAKIKSLENSVRWIEAGNEIEVWSWRNLKKSGWQVDIAPLLAQSGIIIEKLRD